MVSTKRAGSDLSVRSIIMKKIFFTYKIQLLLEKMLKNENLNLLSKFSGFCKFGSSPTNDMQILPHKIAPISMIDEHIAESNEKLIYRFFLFLFFELWLIVFTIYGDTPEFSSVSPTIK